MKLERITLRRKRLSDRMMIGGPLTTEEALESLVLLAFNNEGNPRDFTQKDVREILSKLKYFDEILYEGFED